MSNIVDDFRAFLEAAPTAWHTVEEVGNRLALHDFSPLLENEKWEIEPGKCYFVIRGGALAAFAVPADPFNKALIVAAHTDSPALKLKPCPAIEKKNATLFGVEVYGAPLLSSWLNRELALAGRVFFLNAREEIEERTVFIDDAPLIIPQLAIHLDREVNEKGLLLNKQQHLAPIATLGKIDLETLLRRHLSFHTLLSFDLMLVPMESSRLAGAQNELLAAYRLDNLTSVHAATAALCRNVHIPSSALKMCAFWDHEEIGSRTAEGALSPFFGEVLARVCHALHKTQEEFFILKSNSICISADMAHAFHPHYPDKHDPEHTPLLGKGIVIKHSADHKYATSGPTAAKIVHLAAQNHLPLQTFISRNDIACGSTVGSMIEQKTGIPTIDLGVSQLSMHSAREVIAWQDYVDLAELLTHFLGSA